MKTLKEHGLVLLTLALLGLMAWNLLQWLGG